MPGEYGNVSPGVYFSTQFGGNALDIQPTLSFGKHYFKIILVPAPVTYVPGEGYTSDNSLPKLKGGSRIMFEFKE